MKHITYNIFKFVKIFLFLFFVTCYVLCVTPVNAQTTLPLLVAPARQEITVNPGDSTAVNVRFFNMGNSPTYGFIKVADFIVDNIEGKPRIIEDAVQASPRFSASSWFELPFDKMAIAANDKVAFQTKIVVPKSARPGGRYIAIYFEPNYYSPQINTNGTGVVSRIAALIYIKVAGPINESALISRFFSNNFYEYGPINLETEILNRSDYHIRPKGTITLSNMFGSIINQEKIKEYNIFPDVARNYNNTIGKKWMFGRYKLTLFFYYGDKKERKEIQKLKEKLNKRE